MLWSIGTVSPCLHGWAGKSVLIYGSAEPTLKAFGIPEALDRPITLSPQMRPMIPPKFVSKTGNEESKEQYPSQPGGSETAKRLGDMSRVLIKEGYEKRSAVGRILQAELGGG